MIRSLRARLALGYALALGASLAGAFTFVFLHVRRSLDAQIDTELRDVATAFAQVWRAAVERRGDAEPEALLTEARADNLEFVVFDESEREIASNSRSARLRRSRRSLHAPAPDSLLARPDLAPLFRAAGASGEAFGTFEGPLGTERAYAVAVGAPGRRQIIAVIQGLEERQLFLDRLRRSFRILVPLAAGLALLGGAWLAGRALRPVGVMAAQAGRIGAATLHERIPIADPRDELGHLAGAFNQLLARLEEAFEQQRRFMAEASHELRTPIAVVRGEADLALSQGSRPERQYRESLGVIADEGRRLTQVVDDLFLLARADAGQLAMDVREVDLAALAASSCRALQTLAATRDVTMQVAGDAPAVVHGDEALLRRLVDNLVGNAIKYGRHGGRVTVRIGRREGEVALTVEDDGPGVPDEVRDRIFDRFFRGPDARGAEAGQGGGAGLGLAIARSIAEGHHGTLVLDRSGTDGSAFTLTLPAPLRAAPLAAADVT